MPRISTALRFAHDRIDGPSAIAYAAIILLLVLFNAATYAQVNQSIEILNSGDLQAANDSIRKLLERSSADSVSGSVNIELDKLPVQPSATKSTVVEVPGGRVTIVSTPQGQVIKSTYEGGVRPGGIKTIFWDSYIDLAYNRTSNSALFSGNQHSGADDFPNLQSNKSVSFAIYPSLVGIRILGDHLSLVTGLGLEWLNYRFTNNMTLQSENGVTRGVPVSKVFDGVTEVSKSKLMSSYLNLPLWLKTTIRIKGPRGGNHDFYFLAGLTLGVNLNNHTKIVYHSEGRRRREKNFENLHVAPLRYGLIARAGYGCIGFTASYYMTPLFSKGEGPRVYPFLIGISLSSF